MVSTTDLLIYGLIFMVPIAPWAIFGTVYNASAGMVPLVYISGLVWLAIRAAVKAASPEGTSTRARINSCPNRVVPESTRA